MLKSKNVRRTIALMLCLIMMMSVASFAVGEVSNELLPLSVARFCEKQGFHVSRNAIYDILPLQAEADSESGSVLCVEESEGNITRKGFFVLYEEDDDGNLMATDITRYGAETFFKDYSFSSCTVYAIAQYIHNSNGTYRPTGLEWSYSLSNINTTVSYISVSYICEGTLYTYPDMVVQGYGYAHTITKSASNPVENNGYYSYQELASNLAIDPYNGGGPFFGQGLRFSITTNGGSITDTVGF